jgi:hypothetical protein
MMLEKMLLPFFMNYFIYKYIMSSVNYKSKGEGRVYR